LIGDSIINKSTKKIMDDEDEEGFNSVNIAMNGED
jgi:hypothetical protein